MEKKKKTGLLPADDAMALCNKVAREFKGGGGEAAINGADRLCHDGAYMTFGGMKERDGSKRWWAVSVEETRIGRVLPAQYTSHDVQGHPPKQCVLCCLPGA